MLGRFSPTVAIYSDASSWGMAATHGDHWLVGSFKREDNIQLKQYAGHHYMEPSHELYDAHINIREMGAVYAGASRWARQLQGASVIFITDSVVVEASLNAGRSRSPALMAFLRRLFWLSVEFNFCFISTYINTKVSITCDALSRLDQLESIDRIKGVDQGGRLCCKHIFDSPFPLLASRDAGTGS